MANTLDIDLLGVQLPEADEVSSVAGAPTNQDIIDAAKGAYKAHNAAVDALTTALVADVNDLSLADARNTLDATNWSSPGISPACTAPFFDSSAVASALDAVRRDSAVKALYVGAFAATGPGGGPEVVGFAGDLPLTDHRSGLVVGLDIFQHIVNVTPGQNLQYGVWLSSAADLHDNVLGLYINTTVGSTPVNLKILLTSSLAAYGFVSSTGASVPLKAGVFAGSTSQRTS